MKTVGRIGAIVTLCVSACVAQSAVIYDNSATDLVTRFETGIREVGNEVILNQNDYANRILSQFTFEYFAVNTVNSGGTLSGNNISVTLRLYANNGSQFNGYNSPGALLGSAVFTGITATPRNVLEFTSADFAGTVNIPWDRVTWTVQFSGMGANDQVGLDLYGDPVVGQVFPDYWERTVSGWQLFGNATATTFGATIDAVPEPQVAYLLGLAGLLGLTFGRRLMRRR